MKKEIITAYEKIRHSDKKFSISYIGNPLNEKIQYSITLYFSPDFLSTLKLHYFDNEKKFKHEMSEFGGIIFYEGKNYIRRVNLNIPEEEIMWSSHKGLQFSIPSLNQDLNSTADSECIDLNKGKTFFEYFLMDEVREKLLKELDDNFLQFNLWENIFLTKDTIIFNFIPYTGFWEI